MAKKSKITWTDAGWNPVTGCTKVSEGCRNCYAEREVESRWSKNPKSVFFERSFTDVQCHENQLAVPMRWKKPHRIFVCPRADLFHESVPFEFIDQAFAVMAMVPRHTFQVLTKRPERMLAYMTSRPKDAVYPNVFAALLGNPTTPINWPPANIHLGVTVESQAAADERIPLLLATPAAVRWISVEPMLGAINLKHGEWVPPRGGGSKVDLSCPWQEPPPSLDWVVCGGESGPHARPMHPDWPISLRDQCAAASVPFLFKQWGEFVTKKQTEHDANFCYDNSKIGGWVNPDGKYELGEGAQPRTDDATHIFKLGTKAAGRLLDGVLHDGYPESRSAL